LLAYSVESLLSEKFQAMIDLAAYNSRMKDFYDLYTFLNKELYDEENLKEAIKNTFKKRKTSFNNNHSLFQDDFYQNKDRIIQWKAFLKKANLNTELEFETTMKVIRGVMQPIYNQLKEK
ncbi:MAG: nucleotidyl transferase AbiEii/AbiGii toxin family protein, partial [Bacteroidota bacterium]